MQVGCYSLAYNNTQSLHLAFSQAGSGSNLLSTTPALSSPGDNKVSLSTDGLAVSAADAGQQSADASPAISMLKNVLKQMFGVDVQMVNVQQIHEEEHDSLSATIAAVQISQPNSTSHATDATASSGNTQSASGFQYQEDSSAAFSMSGTIVTKDGQKLNFSLDFSMESHVNYTELQASSQSSSNDKNQSAQQQFTMGNDAGALSGASVLAALTQLFQSATTNSAAPSASQPSNADTNKTANDVSQAASVSQLLAHFKLWPDDSPATPLSQHKLIMNVLPKPDDQQVTKSAAADQHTKDSKPAASIDVSV